MKTKHLNAPLEIKELKEDGSFSGYGSVFGVVDAYGEVVAAGAFKESLARHKERGTMPALLWQHDPRQPVGAYTKMEEDKKGLYVEGKLAMKTQRGAEAHELLSMHAVTGLSIGFIPKAWEDDQDEGVRTLTRIDLWETSIVTFPANEDAQIEAVRAAMELGQIPSKKEFEDILRDAGLSRKQAKALIADGYEGLLAQRDADGGDLDSTVTGLSRLMEQIKAAS